MLTLRTELEASSSFRRMIDCEPLRSRAMFIAFEKRGLRVHVFDQIAQNLGIVAMGMDGGIPGVVTLLHS